MMNMGKVDITGVDLNFTGDISLAARIRLSLSANYTWQKAVDVTNPDKEIIKIRFPTLLSIRGTGHLLWKCLGLVFRILVLLSENATACLKILSKI